MWFRLELGEYASGAEGVQVVRPDGSLAVDDASPAKVADGTAARGRASRCATAPEPGDRLGGRTNGTAQCIVATSLVVRDPDYDVVRSRYRWRVGGKTLRTLTSAALSDVLPLPAGGAVRCDVTPSDGKLSAPAVSATAA
jgi:hypothetical protein